MATYYWLGITGSGVSGNVNTLANWTLWSPNGACGFIPPAALTGPGLNDSIIFTRFNVSGTCYGVDYYPQVAPLGVMTGRTGGGVQHFNIVQVLTLCPVSLGSSDSYFKFNASQITLGIDSSSAVPNNSQSFINVNRGSTGYDYPAINITAYGKQHTYNITGVIKKITTPSIVSSNIATINLTDATINDNIYDYSTGSVLGAATYNLYSVGGTFDILESRSRNTTFNIYPGIDIVAPNIVSVTDSTINFVEGGYSGGSGPDNYPRTNMNLTTSSTTKSYPTINVNHTVDFEYLKLNGGNINFNQLPTENTSTVTTGSMNISTSKITSNSESVTIANGSEFFLFGDGTVTTQYTPDVTLKGNWSMTLLPTTTGLSGL